MENKAPPSPSENSLW